MNILYLTDMNLPLLGESVVTVGNFDGVHRGHLEIFARLSRRARQLGVPSCVVTFDPHPVAVMDPDRAPRLLTLPDEKTQLIEDAGIDNLLCIRFTREFSMLSAADFVEFVLCGSLGARHLVIGHDYAFGRNREGNFSLLEHAARRFGFTLEDCDPVGEGGAIFSSSLARTLLLEGNVQEAASILGREYSVTGLVTHGRKTGREIGFPTANLSLNRRKLLPADGVYAVRVSVGGESLMGACAIGANPTFGSLNRSVEVFLLDFSGNLYDNALSISFAGRVREMRKFTGFAPLTDQIGRDVAECRSILERRN